uniref:Reverse transcriptase domain-containing protein n=1 Tax=Tanacetum cinerariifolium TaxID=118510 RepID=A0A699GYM3_TANCI|nr:hypothetical protein [Tanacetum cinerariifolium]
MYEYDGLPIQPVAPPSPNYVPGPEHPPSPDYVPGPEHPPSPVEVPYVPKPEYPDYLVPSEDEAPIEDQPLPADASPTALSPGYVADFDPEEDPEEDHADYHVNGGDGDDEPSDDDDDDDDTDDEDEEPFEDEEDDEEEEEEHLALTDSSLSPQTRVLFSQTRLRREQKTFRLEPLMSASMEARIAEHAAAPTPPLHVLSPPLSLPSPLTTSPIDAGALLGYKAAGIRMRALLPSTSHRTDVPEAEMPPQKRACFTTSALGLEVGESSTAGAARQPGPTLKADLRRDRVEGIELATTVRHDTEDFQVRFKDAHDNRALLRARVNTLFRHRPFHRHIVMLLDKEATYACRAWASSEDRSATIEAHVRTLEAHVATLIAQTSSLQTQLITALKRIETLEARDPEPQEEPNVMQKRAEMSMTAMTQEQAEEEKAVGHDVTYAMLWKTLKKMMTDKYCPGELVLMCDMMFPEESDVVEKYIGGLDTCDGVRISLTTSIAQLQENS